METPFNFRYTVDDLTLEDYLTIYRILDEDEYPMVEYDQTKNGKTVKKKKRSKNPVQKEERSEKHIHSLKQKVVKYLTDLPTQYLTDDILVEYCMEQVAMTFNNIESKLEDFDDLTHKERPFKQWKFKEWVTLEHRLTKGLRIMDGDEVKETIPGLSWVLPLTYGEYIDDNESLQKKYEYFLKELPIKYTLPLYRRKVKEIETIKSLHPSIYSNDGNGGSGNNMSIHFNVFGWQETLRGLVVNSHAFGTYKETKESPLFEVLEFLNINSSYSKAESADYKAKNKK